MKKTVKLVLVIGCLCALAGFLAFSSLQQSRLLFGVSLADRDKIEQLTATTALSAEECALYWNGVELP